MGAPGATASFACPLGRRRRRLVSTSAALLQREFRAGRRIAIDQVTNWTGALISISAALGRMGAMSLGVGRLAGAALRAVIFLHAEPLRFGFDREISPRLLKFGLPLAGATSSSSPLRSSTSSSSAASSVPRRSASRPRVPPLQLAPERVLSARAAGVARGVRAPAGRSPVLRTAFIAWCAAARGHDPRLPHANGRPKPLMSVVSGPDWTPPRTRSCGSASRRPADLLRAGLDYLWWSRHPHRVHHSGDLAAVSCRRSTPGRSWAGSRALPQPRWSWPSWSCSRSMSTNSGARASVRAPLPPAPHFRWHVGWVAMVTLVAQRLIHSTYLRWRGRPRLRGLGRPRPADARDGCPVPAVATPGAS